MIRYPIPDDHVVVSNVRAVLDGRILDDATIVCDQGRIVAIEEGVHRTGAFDGRGAFCVPGAVSLHAGGLDDERAAGSAAPLPVGFALRSLEARLASAGVTTAFHAISFSGAAGDAGSGARADDAADAVGAHDACDAISLRRTQDPLVDHRIAHGVRHDLPAAWAAARPRVERFDDLVDGSPLVPPIVTCELGPRAGSPDRGDPVVLAAGRVHHGATIPASVPLPADADVDAPAVEPALAPHLAEIAASANRGDLTLLVRGADAATVPLGAELGATVALLPSTVDAAMAAGAAGLAVVADAIDVLRNGGRAAGTSVELVARRCCGALVAEGSPAALLAAAFELARVGVVTLPEAIGLVTAGPAEIAGLHDRGRLAVGRRADLVLVREDGRWPRVSHVVRRRAERDEPYA